MKSAIIVEYVFEHPPSDEARGHDDHALARCFEVREIVCVQTWRSRDGKKQLRVCSAKDAEAVRYAHRSAGVAFASIWAADAPSDQPGP